MTRIASFVLGAVVACGASVASAQSDIAASHKYSWAENVGWMNWRDANNGIQGVQVYGSFLSGYIWGENVGWISVGDGTPGGPGGLVYTNGSGSDHGVNIRANGELFGFAWGENIGWINFDTTAPLGPTQKARYDAPAGRFRGYIWGENVGWVNLDDPTHYVGVCRADFNGDGTVNVADFLAYLNAYAKGDPNADFNGDGQVNVSDVLAFLNAYSAGC